MNPLVESDDVILARRSAKGDEQAFSQLVRRYERQLVTLIRYLLGNAEHAEDVLQETLVQAWIGIHRLREPSQFGAWLLQIARNRCRDFHRSVQWQGEPTELGVLEEMVNRFGYQSIGQRRIIAQVTDALEEVPSTEREVARQFYLEGFTIAEIAARNRRPEGTVKRQLFFARNHLRQTLRIVHKQRSSEMITRKRGSKKQPFPIQHPEIVITEIEAEPFSVDCPELRWWFIVPKIGERVLYGTYDPTAWKLTEVHEIQVVRPGRVHDLDGVEIDIHTWNPQTGWLPSAWQIYGRLTEEKAEYLAVSQLHDGKSFCTPSSTKTSISTGGRCLESWKTRGVSCPKRMVRSSRYIVLTTWKPAERVFSPSRWVKGTLPASAYLS